MRLGRDSAVCRQPEETAAPSKFVGEISKRCLARTVPYYFYFSTVRYEVTDHE